jgi:hypothetical protein
MAVTRKSSNAASRAFTTRSNPDETADSTTRQPTERSSSGGGGTEDRAFEKLLRSDPELLRSLVDQARGGNDLIIGGNLTGNGQLAWISHSD